MVVRPVSRWRVSAFGTKNGKPVEEVKIVKAETCMEAIMKAQARRGWPADEIVAMRLEYDGGT